MMTSSLESECPSIMEVAIFLSEVTRHRLWLDVAGVCVDAYTVKSTMLIAVIMDLTLRERSVR